MPPWAVETILNNPRLKQESLDLALNKIRTPDLFGMLCLTETCNNARMWHEYCDRERGFVIELHALHLTAKSMLVMPITYTDEAIPYLLGGPPFALFSYKRTHWQSEHEWRGIIPLDKCPALGRDGKGFDIHFLNFDPKAIRRLFITRYCSIEMELRMFLSIDCRYHHVEIETIDSRQRD
jgi:hypothetical protein